MRHIQRRSLSDRLATSNTFFKNMILSAYMTSDPTTEMMEMIWILFNYESDMQY